MTIELLTGFF